MSPPRASAARRRTRRPGAGTGEAPFAALRPRSWDAARCLARRLPGYAFRGQPDARLLPSSSIERAAARLQYDPAQLFAVEERMVRELRRRSPQFLLHPPAADDTLGWLALLRHHGAPTRLVDFTRSFYVACWFALESADGDAAIWAVDLDRLRVHVPRLLGRDEQVAPPNGDEPWCLARRALEHRERGGVVEVEPFQVDERLAAQQGMFLLPLDPTRSFMDNLAETFGIATFAVGDAEVVDYRDGDDDEPAGIGAPVIELVLPQEIHRSIRDDLWRMNVTAASFFPGLDGFARSLIYFVGRQQPGEERESRAAPRRRQAAHARGRRTTRAAGPLRADGAHRGGQQ